MSDELTRGQLEEKLRDIASLIKFPPCQSILAHDAALRGKVEALEATVSGYRHSIKIIGQRHDDLKAERDRLLDERNVKQAALRGEGDDGG